jgi:GH24 family phage-related lysozyme (muramidase)
MTKVKSDKGVYRLDRNGKLFIAHREAIALGAYLDGPHYSIGMGYNSPALKLGDTITIERAFQLFAEAIKVREEKLSRFFVIEPSQEQFNAFMSCYYQSGNRFIHDLIDLHNEGDDKRMIAAAFARPEHCTAKGGKYLEGLHKRRLLEGKLYATGEYEPDLDVVTIYYGNPRDPSTRVESHKITLQELPE